MRAQLRFAELLAFLNSKGTLFWAVTSMVTVTVLGLIDFLSGYELSFSLFYVAPIAMASWFASRRLALAVSSASALTWLIADIASGHTYSVPLIAVWNMFIRLGFFVIVTLLLVRLREAYRLEQELARTDRTTGAANARHFYERAQFELDHARRFGHPFTLAYIDLDNFKLANDRFGHAQGDQILKAIGSAAQKHLRSTDLFARLGGDEFALLLSGTDGVGARTAVSKIQSSLLDEMQSHHWPVTFSIGVVTFTVPPASVDAMVHVADELMYVVKNGGKNGVRYETSAA